jgi:hypothetical protein
MSITFVYDATHANINAIPKGALAALYTTETKNANGTSPGIKASLQDFINHPNAIHICQDHGSDTMADMLDSELGAADPGDCPVWVEKARANYNSHARPGQRWPGIYTALNTLTAIANELVAAKLTNVPLWIAHWGVSDATATSDILNASGPFPIVGMQIQNLGLDDFSLFSSTYLANVSGHMPTKFPTNQTGIVHSLTTDRNANVVSNDAGLTWKYVPKS